MLTYSSLRWLVVVAGAVMLLAVVTACGAETVEVPGETVVVEKVVTETVEVPGETVVVEKEVIKTVEVPGETVTKEVVKEVMVPGETVVVKEEVVKTVEVPGQTVVKEVVKTVEVPGQTVVVEKEVVKTVEVPGETVVVEKVVVQEVPGKKYVTDPTTGKAVSAPQYGGTITHHVKTPGPPIADPYFWYPDSAISGVSEKLGIGNWGIDRDVHDFKGPLPVSAITGRLAESWEMPDDKTFIFHIRKGVHWHDKAPMNGRELTADDVEYNFHRMLGLGKFTEAGPCPYFGAAPLVSIPFESITATDKYTVVMKLTEPYLPALGLILNDYFVSIMPPEVIEQYGDVQDWRNLVGTGPFMLTDWVEGSSQTYTKNLDYWGYDEKYPQNRLPYVDEIRTLVISEEGTIMAALRSGKIDWRGPIGGIVTSVDHIVSLQRTNPEIVAHEQWFRSNYAFASNLRVPPFDDIRVRRAMQMAIDLETINNTYFKGFADTTPQGMVGVKGYIIPFEEWPEEVKKGYMYDPEGAEKLLDEAGYTRGADGTRFKTALHSRSDADLGYGEIAVAYWGEIGVDVSLEVYEGWVAVHEMILARSYEGMVGSIAGTAYDPVMSVGWYYSDSGANNRGGSQWPELDALVDGALAATTIEEQQRLVGEADMYSLEKHWQIWGPKMPWWWLVQPWVIGFNGEVMSLGPNEFHVIQARLWIDSELKEAMGY